MTSPPNREVGANFSGINNFHLSTAFGAKIIGGMICNIGQVTYCICLLGLP